MTGVFPARAGMSRTPPPMTAHPSESVPRASGDEPTLKALFQNWVKCSPRERG